MILTLVRSGNVDEVVADFFMDGSWMLDDIF